MKDAKMSLKNVIFYRCMPQAVLRNGELFINAIQPEHIESIRQWRNAQMDILRQAAGITVEQQKSYFERCIWPDTDKKQPDNILLAYLEKEKLIGYGGLVHIAWFHRRAEVSFLMDPKITSNEDAYARYFSRFLQLIKVLAFNDLKLERIFTETYSIRKKHIAVLEASGFVQEGVLTKHVIIDDEQIDSIIHGCLREDTGRVDGK